MCQMSRRSALASLTGCVHKITRFGTFGKKTLNYLFHHLEVCTLLTGRLIVCSEKSDPSIASVGMLWKFSLGCRLVSLTAGHCRVGHYIVCCGGGGTRDDLIGELSVRRVTFCCLWSSGWDVSPSWSPGMPSGSARDCLQRNWQFHPSVPGAVH